MKRLILQIFVYTDLFISICALAMAWEAGFISKHTIPPAVLALVFFATLSSYTFHSLVNLVYPPASERRLWNARHKRLLIVLFLLSSIALLITALPFRQHSFPLILAGFLTFLYSAPNLPGRFALWLRKLAFGKTAYLALMWTYATTYLPMWLSDTALGRMDHLFFGYRFFLIYAICILFDRRDLEEDKIKGIKALPTVLAEPKVRILFYTSIAISALFALLINVDLYLFLLPLGILLPMYVIAQHKKSDWLYYVWLDGLMALTAFLHAILFG